MPSMQMAHRFGIAVVVVDEKYGIQREVTMASEQHNDFVPIERLRKIEWERSELQVALAAANARGAELQSGTFLDELEPTWRESYSNPSSYVMALQEAVQHAKERVIEIERQRNGDLGQLIGWRTAENIAIKECVALRKELQQANTRADMAVAHAQHMNTEYDEQTAELQRAETERDKAMGLLRWIEFNPVWGGYVRAFLARLSDTT